MVNDFGNRQSAAKRRGSLSRMLACSLAVHPQGFDNRRVLPLAQTL
jgi:hypothetical protein